MVPAVNTGQTQQCSMISPLHSEVTSCTHGWQDSQARSILITIFLMEFDARQEEFHFWLLV